MSANPAAAAAEDQQMRVDGVGSKPRPLLIVVAQSTTATTVGWPVGFSAAELTHA